jgi:hypothetical protein
MVDEEDETIPGSNASLRKLFWERVGRGMQLSMPNTELELLIYSPPKRDDFVVEISALGEQFAEVRVENGVPVIEVYGRQQEKDWLFPVEDVVRILEEAKRKSLEWNRAQP